MKYYNRFKRMFNGLSVGAQGFIAISIGIVLIVFGIIALIPSKKNDVAQRKEAIKKAKFLCKDRNGVRYVKFGGFGNADFKVECKEYKTFYMEFENYVGGYDGK